MSVALLYHMGAILAGAMAVSPSSEIERRAVEPFRRYYELINQGYGYRYYSRLDTTVDPHRSAPWGTPVVTAEMEFERPGGRRPREVVRLPDRRRPWPRLRHQRQLDLAYHLSADPRWAASYARHLCKTRGCSRVTDLRAGTPHPRPGPRARGRDPWRRLGRRPRGRVDLQPARETRRIPVRRLLSEPAALSQGPGPVARAGLGRVLLHPGGPDPARADPGRGGRPALLGRRGPGPRPARLPGVRRLDRPGGGPAVPGRAFALGLVVLALGPRSVAARGLGGVPGRHGPLHRSGSGAG